MDDHARILQQRIQVAAFGRTRQQALEGVGGDEQEGEEANADPAQYAEHAGEKDVGQVAREHRDRHRPQGQHQRPQQQRTLVATPHTGNAVVHGRRGVGMQRHILDREVAGDEGPGQAGEGKRDEEELPLRRRAANRHQREAVAAGADHRHYSLDQGEDEGEDEGKMAEFGDHCFTVAPALCACSTACAASGGM